MSARRLRGLLSTVLVTAIATVGLAACGPLLGIVEVAVGEEFACGVRTDGTVVCWGSNAVGQLGDGSQSSTAAPMAPASGITTAVSVAAGNRHACALLADGTVRCWGVAVSGQTGRGVSGGTGNTIEIDPVVAVGVTDATQLAAGGDHACARRGDGSVLCWGRANEGQLGNGSTSFTAQAVPVNGLTGAVSVDVGAQHSCAVLLDGTIRCWGANSRGQLGDGTTTGSSVPVAVVGVGDAAEVDAGANHTCARLDDGSVRCWGRGTEGELGDGGLTNRSVAAPVPGLVGVGSLAAGSFHTCAALEDGSARCWGFNGNGQLGDGSTTMSAAPVEVVGLTDVDALAGGAASTCARRTNGSVRCWGYNGVGGLGDTTRTQRSVPVAVSATPLIVRDVLAVESAGIHTCILVRGGSVECAGQGVVNGELGNGTFANSRLLVPVSGLSGVQAISAGKNHTCALLADSTVRCWGRNTDGQLGNGTTVPSNVPVAVSGLSGVGQIEAGDDHTCAVLAVDGTVRCWGRNANGQLGNGNTAGSTVPVTVTGLAGVDSIGAGARHTCAVVTIGGEVRCWGDNTAGQLGNGTTAPSNVPLAVSGLGDVKEVAGGVTHTCAVRADGTAVCWGGGSSGQLGQGSTGNSTLPVPVVGITDATQITAGQSYTCATLRSGEGRCWGNNLFRVLGDLTDVNRLSPTPVVGLTNITHLSAATASATNEGQHTCALLRNSTVHCWGAGGSGQLSDGGEATVQKTTARPMVREG